MSKTFKPTYLYIKTHNVTKLKYFGKTTKDPAKYPGSGKYWSRHLLKHGNDVTTEILGVFESKEEIEQVALEFSKKNNIVESADWANLKDENGLDGGFKHDDVLHEKYREAWIERRKRPISDETRRKLSESRRGRPSGASGKTRSAEAIKKALETRAATHGFKHSEETKQKMRKPKPAGHGQKVSEATVGKTKSKEHRENLSKAMKARYQNKSSLSSR